VNVQKPSVESQGKIIVESDGKSGVLVMYPDGMIEGHRNPKKADKAIRAWCAARMDPNACTIYVAQVEWRHGLVPPKGKP
jgi:hypothetical protein